MTEKLCAKCGTVKSIDQFSPHHATADKLRPKCRPCRSEETKMYYERNRDQVKERSMARYNAKKESPAFIAARRGYMLKYKYGIYQEDYDRLFASQLGRCAICMKGPDDGKPLHVDHCHATGAVRGLLCAYCNLAVGFVEGIGAEALDYLENTRQAVAA